MRRRRVCLKHPQIVRAIRMNVAARHAAKAPLPRKVGRKKMGLTVRKTNNAGHVIFGAAGGFALTSPRENEHLDTCRG